MGEIIIMEIITVDIQITMAVIQTMADTQQDQHIGQTIMADIQIIMEAILATEMEDIQTIMVGIQVMVIADILAMVMEDTQTMDTLETVLGLQEVIKSKMSL